MQRTSDGNLRVVGRIKDQINRGGEKIASEEIEKLILLHPEVMHAALVAIVDEQFGEKVVPLLFLGILNLKLLCSDAILWS